MFRGEMVTLMKGLCLGMVKTQKGFLIIECHKTYNLPFFSNCNIYVMVLLTCMNELYEIPCGGIPDNPTARISDLCSRILLFELTHFKNFYVLLYISVLKVHH